MLKNYFLVAIRHLKRQPGYALLNILGLTIGIATALLIVLYLHNELSYDIHHEKADQVYRISTDFTEPDNSFRWASTQAVLGRVVKEEFPEVEQYARFALGNETVLMLENESHTARNMWLVDSTVFDLFTFHFVQGDPATALSAPNSIVINQSFAKQVFGKADPVGQFLESENHSYKVTGVFEDIPETSHIMADAMASFSTLQRYYNSQQWGNWSLNTYILLNKNATAEQVERRLNEEIIPKYVATIFDQFNIKIKYELINIKDIHLYSDFAGEPTPPGNIDYVYIFFAVAIFLILIACINYMNLATARSMRRSLEVGIRKVMGAMRGALIRQFIVESVILSFVSILLSFLVLIIVVPVLNAQLGTQLEVEQLASWKVGSIAIAVLLFTGIVSGSYPAFYLSAFSPIRAIKGGFKGKSGNVWVRRVLVGLQFTISLFMLVGTLIIYQQMQYVRNVDMGFDKEQIVYFQMNDKTRERWGALRNRLMENPNIENASTSTTTPGRGYSKNVMNIETNEGVMDSYGVDNYGVDFDYFDVLGIEMVAGRNISKTYTTDTASAVLVNQAMVDRMNWTDPVGKKFQFATDSTKFHTVVGVVKNFHQQSLYSPIEAMMFYPSLNNSRALVKVNGDLNDGLEHIKIAWSELFPETPLTYELLDQNFYEAYNEDQLRGKFFLGFSAMMIIISGLGLLGLSSFTAEQRTKEISVRKVLGANVGGLVFLLIKDFFWLIVFGAIPAFTVGYLIMNRWLSDFEYHINMSPFTFAAVLLIVCVFVVLSTGYQAFRAATSNPSQNLKYE